jgi:hypothetical protein
MIYYTGIGSRETPEDVLVTIDLIAMYLGMAKKFTLRSGGADGADAAFEKGCDAIKGTKEIFLPWQGFNHNESPLFEIPEAAYPLTARYHPAWHNLKTPVRRLMARNAQQVLGKNLDCPSAFVVCWTPDGCTSHETRSHATGGTGQAISIASESGIPVINLRNEDAIDRFQYLITELYE